MVRGSQKGAVSSYELGYTGIESLGYPNSYETDPKEETGAMGQTVGRPPFTACCRAAALPPPPTQYGSREKEREELAQIAKAMLVARSQ